MLLRVTATRYVLPLREGGSMPGLVECSDDGMYVVKFRGAGQGLKVLVAEAIVGELGRAIGVRVPELAVVDLPRAIAPPRPAAPCSSRDPATADCAPTRTRSCGASSPTSPGRRHLADRPV